ncbi:MAG: alpha-amylase [Chlorobium phaeobacteroides]|uniref:Alpha amylase catalytic region n=1 Tax=Chlorobium phaeobacteroides (strain BS1) TaxID=331678 RepID=B3EMF4_CHLPB|nr:alpha-amylase [Chlorobium phaeobacteroides]MBL6956618.1 alpha-amylase [Chlorobium phaeobacteroides]
MTEQTDLALTRTPLQKEHFYISREALESIALPEEWLPEIPTDKRVALKLAEEQTNRINRRLRQRYGDDVRLLLPAQFHAMKLLHAAAHLIMSRIVLKNNPALPGEVEMAAGKKLDEASLSAYMKDFITLFPPPGVFQGKVTDGAYLAKAVNRHVVLEESLFVWLQNQNPALDQFGFLLSDTELRESTSYQTVVKTFLHSLKAMGPIGPENIDPAELLTRPIRHSPNSLLEQLRYISMHWGALLEGTPLLEMIDGSISLIQDEDTWLFFEKTGRDSMEKHGTFFEKHAQAPSYSDLEDAPENYSVDSSWMPEVIMLAKSTFVWLDQLSKMYKRPIRRLQDIPDSELDAIAGRGFTALWLIGLWERSPASRKIKQMQGNPDAISSAYALDSYEVAAELGGYDGYLSLRHRALQRGVRLASDMVPNHTGLDSVLVKEKPEWFVSRHEPPFHAYSYDGPNLSSDPRYGIYIEDGYWDRSDAAVTFKRVDYQNGDTRYIYHGNDGTTMPWNDTAQLNFLSGEVREAVIQQILHVAKMFPVIRFDAAMVLVKKHIQRLWYPLPGHTAGIPSRSSSAMSMEDFNKFIPEEFWREVVDRIHAEAPDTLLLAEAFWMLEGYFVRTLGMHRVYNSAFMHMLKKEDNAGYRYLIKNTLEFDAGILKRYVNFMNNPDEDTAIEQFGKDDKYFGVCVMMVTMPGLPMFGHGQVEGFSEKYGMEYARAYLDESPDEGLIRRHEKEVFPLLKKRYLFAEVEHFFLYDVYSDNGSVEENIFCYSNRSGDERTLVAYNNGWEERKGYVNSSVGFKTGNGIEQRSLCDGLGLSHEHDTYLVFRDHVSNLEFIRKVSDLREQGLSLILGGYRYNVFLDFREVRPSGLMPYDRLCDELNGAGLGSIDRAVLEMSLAPLHGKIARFCSEENLDLLLDETVSATQRKTLFEASLTDLLRHISDEYGTLTGQKITLPDTLVRKACDKIERAASLETLLRGTDSAADLSATLGMRKKQPDSFSHAAMLWVIIESIERLFQSNHLVSQGVLDDLLLTEPLTGAFGENSRLKELPVEHLAALFSSLLSLKMPVATVKNPEKYLSTMLERLLDSSGTIHTSTFLVIKEQHNKRWFRESRFTLMISWLSAVTLIQTWPEKKKHEKPIRPTSITAWIEAMETIHEDAFIAGFETGAFLKIRG